MGGQASDAPALCPLPHRADYFFNDNVHPANAGHQALADLLIGMVQQALWLEARPPSERGPWGSPPAAEAEPILAAARSAERGRSALPPPMQSGVVDAPTSLCLMQVWLGAPACCAGQPTFKFCLGCLQSMLNPISFDHRLHYLCRRTSKWQWCGASSLSGGQSGQMPPASRARQGGGGSPADPCAQSLRPHSSPDTAHQCPSMQKWGWSATQSGAWAELEIDTRASLDAAGEAGLDGPQQQQGKKALPPTTVLLGHVRSWRGMGRARVQCMAGCTCSTQKLNGHWERKATLQDQLRLEVSQAQRCRLRVMVLGGTDSGGHKIVLTSVMTTSVEVRAGWGEGVLIRVLPSSWEVFSGHSSLRIWRTAPSI